jgi:dTDP-4-amino-4,6-dideoxygalactose transaminase
MSRAEGTPTGGVPALDLASGFQALRQELLAEIAQVCESGQYVLGAKVAAFEQQLAGYCGARHALGVSSGTDALLMALMALEIGRGDEVIVPTFTFFGTAGVVSRVGARPVFCDVDPETFNIDPVDVEARITTRTRAVIPVHLYGQMAALRPIFQAVNRHGIAVIEDAAQAIGARSPEYPDRGAGAVGTMGALSFYPTKNLGAIGDAGALLTNDDRLQEVSRKLRVHGSGHTYYHERIGGNFRIDALQAAILAVKLAHLERGTERRRALAEAYGELLEQTGLVPECVRPPVVRNGRHVFHQYVIRAQRRDALAEHLRARQIGCGVYYPLPLHLQACFASLGGKPGQFPAAEQAAAEVLALPMYPELTRDQQAQVVGAIRAFYRS